MRSTDPDRAAGDAHAEAALWHQRMLAPVVDQAMRSEFDAWHAAAPEHRSALAQVEAAWEMAQDVREAPAILALRVETSNRLAMASRHVFRRLAMAAGLAITFAGLGGGVYFGHQAYRQQSAALSSFTNEQYHTRVGERMTLTLVDGSMVTLNTASRLSVRYSDTERHLVLEAGQALFNVAKGQPQPFTVSAGGQTITAHGTEFDVRLDPEAVKVALVEGVVSVRDETRPAAREIRLNPSEMLSAGAKVRSVRAVENMEKLVSWRDGLLIFEDESLGSAVAEMNRYVQRPIVLGDPTLAKLRISGAFKAGSTRTFVDAVTHLFPVKADTKADNTIVLSSEPEQPTI